jgi:hypothetical protein
MEEGIFLKMKENCVPTQKHYRAVEIVAILFVNLFAVIRHAWVCVCLFIKCLLIALLNTIWLMAIRALSLNFVVAAYSLVQIGWKTDGDADASG